MSASTPLSDLCDIQSGGTPSRANREFYDGTIPWAKISDLEAANGLLLTTEEAITELGLEAIRGRLFPVGTLLFAIYGSIGKMAFAGREVSCNQAILGIQNRSKQVLSDRYLYHWLASKQKVFLDAGQGIAQKNLSAGYLRSLQIPLPPLNEQRRIAAILDKADHLRQKRRQAIALLDGLGSALIEEVINRSDSRFMTLHDCLSFVTSGGRNWSRYYAKSGDRFIRSLDVQMNCLSDEEVVFVQAPDNAEARRTRTEVGDVLLTITGSRIGRVAALGPEEAGSYVSQHVAILRPETSKVIPEFLSYFLSSNAGQQQISKWQYGQTKPGLNFEQIRSFEIPNISMDTQKEFVSKARVIASRSLEIYNQSLMLTSLFASLQHRAFNGEL